LFDVNELLIEIQEATRLFVKFIATRPCNNSHKLPSSACMLYITVRKQSYCRTKCGFLFL